MRVLTEEGENDEAAGGNDEREDLEGGEEGREEVEAEDERVDEREGGPAAENKAGSLIKRTISPVLAESFHSNSIF